jgi:hypothetical protein
MQKKRQFDIALMAIEQSGLVYKIVKGKLPIQFLGYQVRDGQTTTLVLNDGVHIDDLRNYDESLNLLEFLGADLYFVSKDRWENVGIMGKDDSKNADTIMISQQPTDNDRAIIIKMAEEHLAKKSDDASSSNVAKNESKGNVNEPKD